MNSAITSIDAKAALNERKLKDIGMIIAHELGDEGLDPRECETFKRTGGLCPAHAIMQIVRDPHYAGVKAIDASEQSPMSAPDSFFKVPTGEA